MEAVGVDKTALLEVQVFLKARGAEKGSGKKCLSYSYTFCIQYNVLRGKADKGEKKITLCFYSEPSEQLRFSDPFASPAARGPDLLSPCLSSTRKPASFLASHPRGLSPPRCPAALGSSPAHGVVPSFVLPGCFLFFIWSPEIQMERAFTEFLVE